MSNKPAVSLRGIGLIVVMIASFASPGAASARAADATPGSTPLHFMSGGRGIQVDYFPPANDLHRPAVVVLNGAGGTIFDGPDMRRMAGRLAAAGYPAYVVHYFNRTGSLVAIDSTMRRHFDEWLPTVREAIHWVHSQPAAGGRPVGVYGYSLGAFLGLAACSDNPEAGALVEQAGGIWYGQRDRLRYLPPVLMVHGRADQRVPFEKFALPLAALLKERGNRVATRFYPVEGHRFTETAEQQVRAEAAEFFDRHLGT